MVQPYNADDIWDSMNNMDRKEALYVAKEPNPDALLDSVWDNIPEDVQDLIDLGEYQLARKDQGGRSLLRGIESAIKENPEVSSFIDKFLKKIGRASIQDITVKQAYKLNPAVWQYIASKKPIASKTPADSNIDPYSRKNPSTGYMGSVYRGD